MAQKSPSSFLVDNETHESLQAGRILEIAAARAYSSLGKSAILARRPVAFQSAEAAEQAWQPVEECRRLLVEDREPPLGGLFDPAALLDALTIDGGGVLALEEFPRLAHFCEMARPLRNFGEKLHRDDFPWLRELMAGLSPLHEEAREIRRVISDEGLVRDSASPTLRRVRQDRRHAEGDRQSLLQRLLRRYDQAGALSDQFITQRGDRYCLPVAAGRRSKVSGIMRGESNTGETIFVEPLEVVELEEKVARLGHEEEREIARILRALSDQLRPSEPAMRANRGILEELDDALGRARFAEEFHLTIPQFSQYDGGKGSGEIFLQKAHHPLLRFESAKAPFRQGTGKKGADKKAEIQSVPIDLELGENDRILLLSGPNAGGKTTLLKTVGLHLWMAHAGLPIPAEMDSRLPLLRGIGTAIGDRQDVLAGESTFSAHLKRLKQLGEEGGQGCLILVDEIAAGTDPFEGAPLAMAILEGYCKGGATTICSSHLTPLKEWAAEYSEARNASFALDGDTHRPTFALRLDVPGTSEAFHMAERVGLSKLILQRAREMEPEERRRARELLSELHDRRDRTERRETELAEQIKEAGRQEASLKNREEKLRRERREFAERMHREKMRDLDIIRAEVERAIAELPPREGLTVARKQLEEAKAEAAASFAEQKEAEQKQDMARGFAGSLADLKPGKKVRVPSLRAEVEVLDIDTEAGSIRLLLNGTEIEMPIDRLFGEAIPQLAESKMKPLNIGKEEEGIADGSDTAVEQAGSKSEKEALDPLHAALAAMRSGREKRGIFRSGGGDKDGNRKGAAGITALAPTSRENERTSAQNPLKTTKSGKQKARKKKKFSEADFYKSTIKKDPGVLLKKKKKTVEKAPARPVPETAPDMTGMTLDLHGFRVEEALNAVDDFLDRSLLRDYPFIRIMHGHGTGALRKAIREHLRTHPTVARSRPGEKNDGGDGVTIVTFHD